MDKRDYLRQLGAEEKDISHGNVGYELEDMEGYFARECAENRLSEGLPVPEEFIPRDKSLLERDLYRRMKNMERLENERTKEDKSMVWPWTDKDERLWQELYNKDNCRQGRTLVLKDKVDKTEIKTKEIQNKRSVVTMVKKAEAIKEEKTEIVEVEKVEEETKSGKLLDFSKNEAIVLTGEWKMRRIWSKKKAKWMFVLEGDNNSIIIGGAGENGKNVWGLVVDSNQKSSEPTMNKIEA